MRRAWALILVLACAVLSGACSAGGVGGQLGPGERPRAWAWDCGQGVTLVTDFYEGEALWLFAPGYSGRLKQSRTASGIRYEGDGRVFWAKGEEARYEGDGTVLHCRRDVGRSWFEDAKLRGADFRAVGNEPGWALEIGPDALFLVTDYGRTRLEFRVASPEVSQAGRIAVWRAEADGQALEARVEGRPCQDSMSGEGYESTVRLVLNGGVMHGCGQALH